MTIVNDAHPVIYVTIGNSDNKLSQKEWATFYRLVERIIASYAGGFHGKWFSNPVSEYQNACFCFWLKYPPNENELKDRLASAGRKFKQDSIAWVIGPTELLTTGGNK